MNILVIRPDAIGDCVLITPALAALKNKFPDAKITVLVKELTRDVFLNNPNVGEIITDERSIKKNKFDLSVHFYNEFHYAWLAYRLGIKHRLGDTSKPLLSWLYNIRTFQNWRDITKHEVTQNLALLKPLGIVPPDDPKLELFVDQESRIKIDKILADHGVSAEDKIIGLHLSTGLSNKAWLPERFGEVARHFTARGYKIVASGQATDKQLIAEAQKAAQNKIIDLSTKTSLRELIALTSRYTLFIGVDTGPLHIAAALNVPVVAIFTSPYSYPSRWGPWQTKQVVVKKMVACEDFCRPRLCRKILCAEQISSKEIIAAAEQVLTGEASQPSYQEWLKKTFSIMITYSNNKTRAENVYRSLARENYNVVLIDTNKKPNLTKLFKELNINILHAIDNSLKIRLTTLCSGPTLVLPVLYVKDNPIISCETENLLSFYQETFTKNVI